jgi:hypothetical protein
MNQKITPDMMYEIFEPRKPILERLRDEGIEGFTEYTAGVYSLANLKVGLRNAYLSLRENACDICSAAVIGTTLLLAHGRDPRDLV